MRATCLLLCLGLILGFSASPSAGLVAADKVDIRSVVANRLPVMLQFGKSWCPRCQSTKTILDNSARAYAGRALIVPVDVDVNKDLVRDFRIRLIPTQIFLSPDGREFFRHEGVLQERQIAEILSRIGLERVEVR